MKSLDGKVALVTGGGRGIGRGISLALAAEGCAVAINYVRRRADAEECADAVRAQGGRACVLKAHVGDDAQMERLAREAADTLGDVDIFVANAASGVLAPAESLKPRAWDWALNINARSLLVGAQALLPAMRERGWGRIIAISSIGGRRVYQDYASVGVSKAALEALVRYLAVESAPHGVTVNTVSPGLVITDALDAFPQREQMIAHASANTPAGRLVTPQDVGALVAWLCSDGAAMVQGQTIELDGGYSLLIGQ
jgi:enoyl-[acyl-carrier protein] reductase III